MRGRDAFRSRSSSPPSAAPPSRRARRRSTSLTPSATCCPPSTRTSSGTYARLCPELEQVALSAHCHDDLGLAVANSLAALDAGVQQLECTDQRHRRARRQCLARGDRDGDARARRRAAALHTDIDLTQIGPALAARRAAHGLSVPPNKAIVGANAFAHEAGIHQDGAAQGRRDATRSSDPGELGLAMTLPLGKHSGATPSRAPARRRGLTLDDDALVVAFARFKARADEGGAVSIHELFQEVTLSVTPYSIALSRGRRDRARGDGPGEPWHAGSRHGCTASSSTSEHVPFGADATMRFGHPFPLASRNTALAADAILAATIDPTLLHALEGELDLRAAVMRVRLHGRRDHLRRAAPHGRVGLDARACDRHARDRAAVTSRSSGARTAGRRGGTRLSDRDDGLERHASLHPSAPIRALVSSPESFDVVVCDSAAARPHWPSCAGASTRGACSPGARLAGDRPRHLRAEPRNRRRHRRPGRRRPELDAARGGADARRGSRRAGGRGNALLRGLVRARERRQRALVSTVSMSSELTDAVLARLPQSHSNAEFLTEAV